MNAIFFIHDVFSLEKNKQIYELNMRVAKPPQKIFINIVSFKAGIEQ